MEPEEAKKALAAKEAAAAEKEAKAARRSFILALAGSVVAVVGVIVGAGSTWLISREDRSSQQALAREAHAYQRRASAYLEALSLFQPVSFELGSYSIGTTARQLPGGRSVIKHTVHFLLPPALSAGKQLLRLHRVDKALRLKLLAFGSPAAIKAYEAAWRAARAAQIWAERADLERTGDRTVFKHFDSRYTHARLRFNAAFHSLIAAVRQDIG